MTLFRKTVPAKLLIRRLQWKLLTDGKTPENIVSISGNWERIAAEGLQNNGLVNIIGTNSRGGSGITFTTPGEIFREIAEQIDDNLRSNGVRLNPDAARFSFSSVYAQMYALVYLLNGAHMQEISDIFAQGKKFGTGINNHKIIEVSRELSERGILREIETQELPRTARSHKRLERANRKAEKTRIQLTELGTELVERFLIPNVIGFSELVERVEQKLRGIGVLQ